MRNVYLLISQGNVYRDLVRLGMLQALLQRHHEIRVILLTQAWAAPDVLAEVAHERVVVARHDMYSPSRWLSHLQNLRRKVKNRGLSEILLRVDSGLTPSPPGLQTLFRSYPPALIVSTHPKMAWEWDAVAAGRRARVPTLGIVKSWDNVFSRLPVRTDRVAVWGRRNAREAVQLAGVRSDCVEMVGSPAFDRYFTPGVLRPREEFWRSKGLDPDRPIVLFGTAGAFTDDWDETFMMDLLLELTEAHEDLRETQFVCRLHPISRLGHFWPYREHPRVTLSFGSYVKTLGWCMTRDEVDEMANFLAHADIVLTPASTLAVEGPIFDTPTIVTFFSTVRPDLHAAAAKSGWLDRHFREIRDADLLPLAFDPTELLAMIRRSFADRAWYREGRRRLVEDVVTFTDGQAYLRVAELINRCTLPGREGADTSEPAS